LLLTEVRALGSKEVDGLLLGLRGCLNSGSDTRRHLFLSLLIRLFGVASIVNQIDVMCDDPDNRLMNLVNEMETSLSDLVDRTLLVPVVSLKDFVCDFL